MQEFDLNKYLEDFDRECRESRESRDRQEAANRELRAKENERMDKLMGRGMAVVEKIVSIAGRIIK